MTSALQCADTSGFLFSHPCDRLATGQCATCGKPICIEHTRLTATGPRCVTCLRDEQLHREDDRRDRTDASAESSAQPATVDEPPASEGQFGGAGASAGWSPEQAAAAGTDPHFYGGPAAWSETYSPEDQAAFEPAASPDDPDAGSIESDPGGS